jgi:hypothetical protein
MNSFRRYIQTALVFVLFTTGVFSQDARTGKFNQGVTFFTAGNYKEALQAIPDIDPQASAIILEMPISSLTISRRQFFFMNGHTCSNQLMRI